MGWEAGKIIHLLASQPVSFVISSKRFAILQTLCPQTQRADMN